VRDRRPLCSLALVPLFLLVAATARNEPGARIELIQAALRPFVEPTRGVVPEHVASTTSGYYLLDSANHRILALDRSKKLERQIGQIGQEKEAFYYPSELDVDPEGRLYVLDDSAKRVQVLRPDGKLLSDFVINGNLSGFAVTPTGHILLGDPQGGAIVAEFEATGRLIKRFGGLRHMSDFYGQSVSDMDRAHTYAANRVLLATDNADDVYVAFQNAPAIQKYDSRRNLEFERLIEGDQARTVREGVTRTRTAPFRHGLVGDGTSGPFITNGLAVNKRSGTVYVSFQWDRSWIYVADTRGAGLAVLTGTDEPLRIHNISMDEERHVLLVPRFSMRGSIRTYEIELPRKLW